MSVSSSKGRAQYRDPVTKRFARDPLFSPVPPAGVESQSTPIWDSVVAEVDAARESRRIPMEVARVSATFGGEPVPVHRVGPNEFAIGDEVSDRAPWWLAAGVLALVGLAVGLFAWGVWAVVTGSPGMPVGVFLVGLAVFALGPVVVLAVRDAVAASRSRRVGGDES